MSAIANRRGRKPQSVQQIIAERMQRVEHAQATLLSAAMQTQITPNEHQVQQVCRRALEYSDAMRALSRGVRK